jgi:general secretion pathway protein M
MTRTETLQAWWAQLAERERRMVRLVAALVSVALVWWIALAPALHTLRAAPAEHAELDAQLQKMSALQMQAQALKTQPRSNRDEALRALESSVRQGLGTNSQLVNSGGTEGASILLRATPADALAPWLTQARANARAVPREVHLTRVQASAPSTLPASITGTAGTAAAADTTKVRWEGTMLMTLPASR